MISRSPYRPRLLDLSWLDIRITPPRCPLPHCSREPRDPRGGLCAQHLADPRAGTRIDGRDGRNLSPRDALALTPRSTR